jgi:hypothetical protein
VHIQHEVSHETVEVPVTLRKQRAVVERLDAERALDEDRASRCDGLAGSLEISGTDLARQTGQGKALRVTRRQDGLEAPDRCAKKSDYSATLIIRRESARIR